MRASFVETYEGLVELLLLEEFVTSVEKEVSMHVIERDISRIEEAARLADKFNLARNVP